MARYSSAFRILALVQATLIFTIALIMVPLPRIAGEFGLSAAEILLLQVAYGLPFSGLLLFGGRLADRYGGRRIFVVGLILFGGASVIAALAPDFRLLAGMRFLQGVGGALVAPSAMAILRVLFPAPQDFGRAMATWGGVSVLGAILGFVVSGILTNWISWRFMFLAPILVALIGLATARRVMPKSPEQRQRPALDLAGALLATAGIVLFSIGLIASTEYSWNADLVRWPLIAGVLLLALFIVVELKVRDPLLPPRFILEPCRIIGLLGMLFAAAGSLLIEFVLSLYLQNDKDWSPLMTAVAFLPFAIALIAGNHVAARLVGRLGAAPVTIAGFLIGAIGLAVLAFIARETSYVAILLPGQVLLAIGMAFIFSGSAVLSTTNVPPHQGGLAGGVMNTTMELGPTLGFAGLMAVAAMPGDKVQGYGWAFAAAAVVYGVTALVGSVVTSRRACVIPVVG